MRDTNKEFCSIILMVALLNALSINTLKGNDLINSYDIYLEINPKNQSITAELSLELNQSNLDNDTLLFFLHKELSIISIEPNHDLSFNFLKEEECPYFYMRNARPLKIILKQTNKTKAIIHIKYQGLLKDIAWGTTNMLTNNWIELGNYSAWFPYNPEYGNFSYSIQLVIEDRYNVSGMGKIKKRDGKWEIIQDYPVNDIVIMASRELKSINYLDEQYQIRIDYILAKDEKAKELIEDAKFILQLYNDWFFSKKEKYTIVFVPPFPDRGSYFRKGFIAMLQPVPGLESDITTFKLLAHEFAHDWWSGANTNNWEDWLNESFAEYSCLMAIREKYGNEIFNDWINYKTYSSKFAEPVIGHMDNKRTSYSTRYDKGPLALYHLEILLGKEKFIGVLKKINERKITTTDELLNELEKLTSQKDRKLFEDELRR
ncbi:MAG: hypothetical protein AMS27_17940 [Bacteroides sp. SM23_62_1]|nr:MAG: hypothetical protein AMS27_17940 [Bacteroides sp. SM23_62_1]